ncbi:uncharacterized protein LOC114540653 [Dendronephthya gigantea]|uniref:uncharacterized protein LOC114540653 n=1 Tax=Dendronephthya gigantea TaxID=151771 RepID=UPI00106D2088|nr:uncharacterized protein LOC114540653 [Dendronephthya gigantea]
MADVYVPRFSKDCSHCGYLLKFSYNFCPQCGEEKEANEERDYDERAVITAYFTKGHEYSRIVEMLEKEHNVTMSIRTLKNRLNEYGLKRRNTVYDEQLVRQRIEEELNGPGCMGGYRSVWHTLKLQGLQVPRDVVEQLVRELDPDGCSERKAKRLKRRRFRSPGPNYSWHADGYDKLKPYGFPIHGAIDGWSRKILWLKLCRSNNFPEIPASFFLECVAEQMGCPEKMRTDNGTENGIIAVMQCLFRDDVNAHSYGKSTANQRIEGWWSYLRRNRSTWWINLFKDLVETGEFSPGNEVHMECLWFCFSGLIQQDLDVVREHWNTHTIRASSYDTISGKPNELYVLPESRGGEDRLHLVSAEEIEFVAENLLQFEEIPNDYEEYFEYILTNSNIERGHDWLSALNMYRELLNIFNDNN